MPLAMAQRPPPNPRPRRLSPCPRHPGVPTTLCAPCLRERLSLLNPSAAASTSSTTSAAAPELRRCKSFSANKCEAAVGLSFEPRRRSCDVRSRNTLSTLFDIDDDGGGECLRVESRNLGFLRKAACSVPEVREVEEEEFESHCHFQPGTVADFPLIVDEFEESKTMKEFIDLEFQASSSKSSNKKDFKDIAGSFWVAASVFSKKLRIWRKKQGTRRKDSIGYNADGFGAERSRGRRLRDTQSEVGEYGFGRRSCDTDPKGSLDLGRASIDGGALGRRSCDSDSRFSIDLGRASIASIDCARLSVDEARCSFDAPRASWDGYLLGGGRTLPRGNAPVVSVIENAMATVYGFDHHEGKIKVENGDRRDFRGFHQMDRSNSLKRDVMSRVDRESKMVSDARVSPAAIGIFNGTKLLITEKELNEWRLNSVKDGSSESFETASKDLASVSSSSNGNGSFKKCRQWSKLWSVWGLLNQRKGDKSGNKEKLERGNVECPQADLADTSARNGNGQAGFGSGPDSKLVRSHSTASSRGSSSRTESKAIVRRRQENVLERNRSAKLSSNQFDSGLLRFYLTPLRSRRRYKPGKSRLKESSSLARSVFRL